MKLKSKLIPILTVASAATIATPLILTSCAKTLAMDDLLLSDTAAKPTFSPIQNQDPFETNSEATEKYIEFIKEDPSRWVQDAKWGIYQNWMSFFDWANYGDTVGKWELGFYDAKLLTLEAGVSEPTFDKVNIAKPSSRDVEYNTISFKMKVHVVAMVNTIDPTTAGTYITRKIETTVETEYKDMIFFAYPASTDVKGYPVYAGEEANDRRVPTGNPDSIRTGWFITISDNSEDQEKYKYYTSKDWGIKYSASMKIETTRTDYTTGQKTKVVDEGAFDGNVNKYETFNQLVNLKNYKLDSSAMSWYEQDPGAILANALLLDVITYYYSSVVIVPSIKAEKNLEGEINPVSDRTTDEAKKVILTGWGFQDSNISAQSGLQIESMTLTPYIDGEEVSSVVLNEKDFDSSVHDGEARNLTLKLGKKSVDDEDFYINMVDIAGGVIDLYIPAMLNEGFNDEYGDKKDTDEYLYNDMQFALPKNLKIKMTITFTAESQHEDITSWIDFAEHSNISIGLPARINI